MMRQMKENILSCEPHSPFLSSANYRANVFLMSGENLVR